jgi:hypothetical protein
MKRFFSWQSVILSPDLFKKTIEKNILQSIVITSQGPFSKLSPPPLWGSDFARDSVWGQTNKKVIPGKS